MNVSGIDLNLLQVFDALMSERNVTRAGAKIGLSQPALSNALRRLRDVFGDKLFVKGRRAMVPTPRALEIAPDVEAAIASIRRVFQQPEFRPALTRRKFRLALTDDIEALLLPVLISRLSKVAPGISLNCLRLPGIFKLPQADLQSGALDFALGAFPNPQPTESGLFVHPIYDSPLVCLVRKNHPVIKHHLSLAQYCKLDHVATFYYGEGPGLIDRILGEQGRTRNVKLSLAHWFALPYVVANSDLIATVPESATRMLDPRMGLRRMTCPLPNQSLRVSLVWHNRTHESVSHAWFREFLIKIAESRDHATA